MKVKELEGLIDFIAKSGLQEVNLETEQIKLAVKRNAQVSQKPTWDPIQPSVSELIAPPDVTITQADTDDGQAIVFKSPMIGTFYRAPQQGADPFVQVGQEVQQGDTLCIIEAMKLFNEIEADTAGIVTEVLVEDASPVEYDQPLFRITPHSSAQ